VLINDDVAWFQLWYCKKHGHCVFFNSTAGSEMDVRQQATLDAFSSASWSNISLVSC